MRFLHSKSQRPPNFRVPLRLVLVVPFVLQIVVAVGLTGWFSLRNGQKAVNDLAAQLRNQTSTQVAHHLEDQLVNPQQINQLNVEAINIGTLNLQDFDRIGRTFYRQMQLFKVSYINFANPQGEFIGVERLDDGTILINETKKPSLAKMSVYKTDGQGKRIKREKMLAVPSPVFEEAWYADAVKAKKPIWSDIYQWDDKPEVMSISSSYPLYNSQKQLLGVIGVDLILSELSHFLQGLQVSPSGEIFIIERNGALIASSASEPPFIVNAGKAQRLKASQSHNPLIQATATYLTKHFSNLAQIQTVQVLNFQLAGQQQFVQVTPWTDRYGLDWLIIVVVPEAAFMEQINANTDTTILLCIFSLIAAILLGLITSRWICQWIQHLVKISQEIAHGNLSQTAEAQGIQELEALSQSFNQMAAQLKASFSELDDRVAQRTAELVEAKNAAEASNYAKSEFLEAMSHELRTPLNAILGVAQVLQHDTSLTPEHQERLKMTQRNGNHLLALINDLLEIAKAGMDQLPSVNNRFDRDLKLKTEIKAHQDETIDQKLTEYLAQMPPEWVSQLSKAAITGFDQDIFQLVKTPAIAAPLATSLTAWVKDFQFDKVIDLVQKTEQRHSQD